MAIATLSQTSAPDYAPRQPARRSHHHPGVWYRREDDIDLPAVEHLLEVAQYLRQVEDAARTLTEEGYLLQEDLDGVVERASSKFDYFSGQGCDG